MNRLEKQLEEVEHPGDVGQLREAIPRLQNLPGIVIESLYRGYSAEVCAGWLIVDEDSIQGFKSWLGREDD